MIWSILVKIFCFYKLFCLKGNFYFLEVLNKSLMENPVKDIGSSKKTQNPNL